MAVKFRELQVFWAVYKCRSVKAAGKLLNVSQPAVSMMLKSAEERFGIKLFERQGGRLRATPEARALFESTDNVFLELEQFERQLARIREGNFGVIRVAGTPTLIAAFVHPALASFHKLHPDVRIVINTVPSQHTVDIVAQGSADFGLIYGPGSHAAVATEDLSTSEVACLFRSDHRFAAKSSIRPRDLAGEIVTTYRLETPFGRALERMLRGPGSGISIAIETTALTAAYLANSGYGVALIDPFVLNGGLFNDLLVRPFKPTTTARVQLVMRREEPLSLIGQDLLGRIRAGVPRQFASAQSRRRA